MNGGSRQGDKSLTVKLVWLERRVNDLKERLKWTEKYNELSQRTTMSLLLTTRQLSLSGKKLVHALDRLMDTTGKTLGAIHSLIPYLEKIRDRE